MKVTPNYILPQIEGNDFFDKEVLNDGFRKIDTAISDIQESINILEPEAMNHISELKSSMKKSEEVVSKNEELITKGGLATKGDIQVVNSSLEEKANQSEVTNLQNTKANKTETQNIQSQINNLILGAVGSGNNAEVIQARAGSQGASFITVKEHFDNIENSFNKYTDKKHNYTWVIGTINSNQTINTNLKYRIVTSSFQYADEDITIKTNWDIYRVAYHTYSDGNGSNPVDNSWKFADIKIPKGTYFRLIVAYKTEDTALVLNSAFNSELFSNLSIEFTGSFKFIKEKSNEVESAKGSFYYLENRFNCLDKELSKFDLKHSLDFILGDIGSNGVITSKIRAVNKTLAYADEDLEINTDWTKYRIFLYYYTIVDGVETQAGQGWKTSKFIIPSGKYYRIILDRLTETTDIIEPKGEMFNALNISFKKSYEKIKEEIFYLKTIGVKGVADYIDKKFITDWTIGSIGANGIVSYNLNRIVMLNTIYADKDLKISIDWTKYRVGLTTYGDLISPTPNNFDGWKTSNFEIKKGSYFRLQVARHQDKEVPLTEIYGDMYNSLTVGSNWSLSRLKEMPEDIDKNPNINSINHRGYNWVAPENTIPAYKLSYKKGFRKFEIDVAFTKDNIPILLHDNTINRTGRNADGTAIATTIDIKDINYNDLLVYDFGIYKSTDYAGTKITKFEEFIKLCKDLGCHSYIEIKRDETHDYTKEQVKILVDIVKKYGMIRNVTWISFHYAYFPWILEFDKRARIGFIMNEVDTNRLNLSAGLQTDFNDIFINVYYTGATESVVNSCIEKNVPLEVWGINSETDILNLNNYISGMTTDTNIAGNILMKRSL